MYGGIISGNEAGRWGGRIYFIVTARDCYLGVVGYKPYLLSLGAFKIGA